jgi:hypothetical protein
LMTEKVVRGYCHLKNGHNVELGKVFNLHKDGRDWVCQCPAIESPTGQEALAAGYVNAAIHCRGLNMTIS